MREDIAIATATFYKNVNDARLPLAIKTIQNATAAGHIIVVVDESPDLNVSKLIEKETAIEVHRVCGWKFKGMANSRRHALELAAKKAEIIVWMEPEKYPFVEFVLELAKVLIAQGADMLVPTRISVEGYPIIQQMFERINNALLELVAGQKIDHCVGVRVMNRRAVKYILDYRSKVGDN